MDITVVLFYQPIYNLLVVLYRLFGNDLALAIITVAILARLLLFPFTQKQIKMGEQSQEMNKKIQQVKEKYKNDKEKQSQELMKVQSQYLPGQLSGCLALIIQLILFINIFNVIRNLFIEGVSSFNAIAYSFVPQLPLDERVNGNFLGILDLSRSASEVGLGNLPHVLPYLVLAVLVGVSQYLSSKILMGLRQRQNPKATKTSKQKSKDKQGEEVPDFSEIMQQSTRQTMIILPFLAVSFALNVASGLSLYWTVQSGLVIIQQLLMERFSRRNSRT